MGFFRLISKLGNIGATASNTAGNYIFCRDTGEISADWNSLSAEKLESEMMVVAKMSQHHKPQSGDKKSKILTEFKCFPEKSLICYTLFCLRHESSMIGFEEKTISEWIEVIDEKLLQRVPAIARYGKYHHFLETPEEVKEFLTKFFHRFDECENFGSFGNMLELMAILCWCTRGEKKMEMYKTGAEIGHRGCQEELARDYEYIKDYISAYAWRDISAQQEFNKKYLAEKMTSEQIAQARELARKLLEEIEKKKPIRATLDRLYN